MQRSRPNVLLYLIRRYYSQYKKLYGRKKIQKLLFLIEHLDLKRNAIVSSTGLTGYRFKIWLYGPFSEEIYQDLEKLVEKKLIVEEVISSDSRVKVNEADVLLPLYEDDGTPKVIYVYYPRRYFHLSLREKSDIDNKTKEKINVIITKFGHYTPTELEEKVLEYLGLTPDKKLKYMGMYIDDYLKKKRGQNWVEGSSSLE